MWAVGCPLLDPTFLFAPTAHELEGKVENVLR